MNRFPSWFSMTVVITFISIFIGCSPVQRCQFNSTDRQQVHSISLLKIDNPPQYDVQDPDAVALGLGGPFGAVGGLIAGKASENREQNRKDQFDAALKNQGFDFALVMTDQIQKQLNQNGYNLTTVSVPREDHKALIKDYAHINASADAYLDIVPNFVGYYNDFKDFPCIEVLVRLVNARTQKTLYAEHYVYCYSCIAGGKHIKANPISYKNFEEMIAHSDEMVKELTLGTKCIAQAIARDLQ